MAPTAAWIDKFELKALVEFCDEWMYKEENGLIPCITWRELGSKAAEHLGSYNYQRTAQECDVKYQEVLVARKSRKEGARRIWSLEEQNLVIDFYNDSLEEEQRDPSKEKSWEELDAAASAHLAKANFQRTPNACSTFWEKYKKKVLDDNVK